MKKLLALLILLVAFLKVSAQDGAQLLDKHQVTLRGKKGITVFKNSTTDTIKLKGQFFSWLPYTETNFSFALPPGAQDSLSLYFNYPDFILINNFRVYNGPGNRLVCNINNANGPAYNIEYSGTLADENRYYFAYNKFLGNYDNESRPYYTAGDIIKNWDDYPSVADSITHIRLNFLDGYKGDVSAAFKTNEHQRLLYNGIMRKYNVLASKEFYGGSKIPVSNHYYDFEKKISFANPRMVLNTEYLWVTDAYLFKAAKAIVKPVADPMIHVIDSLVEDNGIADMLKMRRLFMLYTSAKDKYDILLKTTRFADTSLKTVTDSLVHVKLGLPKTGKAAPGFILPDASGKQINLADFTGKTIIINFWATWCGPCIKEFPADNQLYQEYKSKGLVVMNICVDSKYETWQRMAKANNLQMVSLFANGLAGERIKKLYNISALPRSILINKQGIVTDNYLKRASQLTAQDIKAILSY